MMRSRTLLCLLLAFSLLLPDFQNSLAAAGSAALPRTGTQGAVTQEMVNRSAEYGVSPFVGTIATGISLLVAYGPQIIAMTQTLVLIGAAVMEVVNSSSALVDMVAKVSAKLRGVVKLSVGPLAAVGSVARDQANEVQGSLLKMTGSLTGQLSDRVKEKDIKDPAVSEILDSTKKAQQEAEKLVSVAREGENTGARLENISLQVTPGIERCQGQLGDLGAFSQQSSTLVRRVGEKSGEIKQEFVRARLGAMKTTQILADVNQDIEGKLRGREPGSLSLSEAGVDRGQLVDKIGLARDSLDTSRMALDAASVQTGELHVQIMESLNALRATLLAFAEKNGASLDDILKKVNNPGFKTASIARLDDIQKKDTSFNRSALRVEDGLKKVQTGSGQVALPVGSVVKVPQADIGVARSVESSTVTKKSARAPMSADELQKKIDRVYEEKIASYQRYLKLRGASATPAATLNDAYNTYLGCQKEYDNLLLIQYHSFQK